MNIAVFPGSFDPVTRGHVAVLTAALPLFDKIYVSIGINADKHGTFPIDQRIEWLKQCFQNEEKVNVISYSGLTIDLCRELSASYIIRGIRNPLDFQYEKDISLANKQLCPNVETLFFATAPELAHVSSSIVRDVWRHQGDYAQFLPDGVSLPKP